VFVALARTVREYDLPRKPLADLLVAFRRDQVQTRYETLGDLLTYCEKSANPVGRTVLCLGRSLDDENARLSDSICTGLQLANFWQDVRRDYERGRTYIPQEHLARHGWDDAGFAAAMQGGHYGGGAVHGAAERHGGRSLQALLEPLVAQADAMLLAGQPLAERVHPDLRLPVRVFIDGGRAILAAIRSARYDVWSRRPTVGRLKKLAILARAWWRG
jgi:squalene synthase HpnC